jgi:hypothetical protein
MERKLIQVCKVTNEIPVKRGTLYVWHHLKRYPEIFVKVGSILCVDLDTFHETFKAGAAAK